MSLQWFRFYHEVLDDPKVQSLSPEDFKFWVNMLCLACRRNGKIPNLKDISFGLRITTDACQTVLERLSNAGLLDRANGGADGYHYAVHGWNKRQYKSDTSTERVKRFRKRFRNDAVTAYETGPDTETDTETESTLGYSRQEGNNHNKTLGVYTNTINIGTAKNKRGA